MAAARKTRDQLVAQLNPKRLAEVIGAEVDEAVAAIERAGRLPYEHPAHWPQDVCDELKALGYVVVARKLVLP
jgi:hypothetical protein